MGVSVTEKQKRPNNTRDIRGEILRALKKARRPLTVRELQEAIPEPMVSTSAIRGNLYGLTLSWSPYGAPPVVEVAARPKRYKLREGQ